MQRILVVDDSPTAVFFVRAVLESRPYEILEAKRPGTIAELPGPPPALVLLDLHLPGWSQEEVLEELTSRWPDGVSLVVHSSYPDEKVREAARSVGALGVIPKGLGPDELEEAIEAYLPSPPP